MDSRYEIRRNMSSVMLSPHQALKHRQCIQSTEQYHSILWSKLFQLLEHFSIFLTKLLTYLLLGSLLFTAHPPFKWYQRAHRPHSQRHGRTMVKGDGITELGRLVSMRLGVGAEQSAMGGMVVKESVMAEWLL